MLNVLLSSLKRSFFLFSQNAGISALSIALALSMVGCKDSEPEFTTLDSVLDLTPSFSGKSTYIETITAAGDSISVTGSCDRRVQKLEISYLSSGWMESGDLVGDFAGTELNCSDDGEFTIVLASAGTFFSLALGDSENIKVRGTTLMGLTSETNLIVLYTAVAGGTPPVGTGMTPATIDEDVSTTMTLGYTDDSPLSALTCAVTASSVNLMAPGACACALGVCTVSLQGTNNSNGAASITYTITDADGTSSPFVANFTIAAVDDAPVPGDITPAAFDEDTASTITLSFSDAEGHSPTACAIQNLTNVTVTTACACAAGSCTVGVTGTANHNGAASFQYKITANGLQSVGAATASLTIDAIDDVPVANASSASTAEDTAVVVTLDYSDIESDIADSCAVANLSSDLSEVAACDCDIGGACTYEVIGDSNFNGTATFEFTVTNAAGTSNSALATITITAVDDAPSITVNASDCDNDIFEFDGDKGTFEAANPSCLFSADDPEGDAITWSLETPSSSECDFGATQLALANTTATTTELLGTPDEDDIGTCKYKVRATSSGGYDEEEITITVQNFCDDIPQSGWTTHAEGEISGTYYLCNASQLVDFSANHCGDAFSTGCNDNYYIKRDVSLGALTNGIGSPTNKYNGNFNGNNKTISGINLNQQFYAGLFNIIGPSGYVYRLNVSGQVEGEDWVGLLAGKVEGLVEQISASGFVDAPNNLSSNVGGVIGEIARTTSATFTNIESSVEVTAGSQSANVGGVVGNATVTSGTLTFSDFQSSAPVTGEDYVGGLFGRICKGYLSNSFSSSNVTGLPSVSAAIGGLVGQLECSPSQISSSYSTGNIMGTTNLGGVAGTVLSNSRIQSSYHSGTATGVSSVGGLVGRLVSSNTVSIERSHASSNVTGSVSVGGLVGYFQTGRVNLSYANGAVVGSQSVGGLIGYMADGHVYQSFATGQVSHDQIPTGVSNIGGLIGHVFTADSIDQVFATGDVVGYNTDNIGGLIGQISSLPATMTNCFARGDVSGDFAVGGLVGRSNADIENCYAMGASTAISGDVGGFLGQNIMGSDPIDSFYNSELNGLACGSGMCTGGPTGLPEASFSLSANFSSFDTALIWSTNADSTPIYLKFSYDEFGFTP